MSTIHFSILYFVTIIVIAHFFAPPEYQWTQNTISDLAAQGVTHQWIMQAGFIGFGLLLNLGFVQKFRAIKKVFYGDVLVMLYGLAVLLSGVFSTAPFLPGVSYSVLESRLHSMFAEVAGILFSLGIFASLLAAPTARGKWFHALFFLLVIGASLSFGLSENGLIPLGKGLVQRTLYLVSFVWLASHTRLSASSAPDHPQMGVLKRVGEL